MLEERRDLLDGSDCYTVRYSQTMSRGGQVSRLTIARFNHFPNPDPDSDNSQDVPRPGVNYYKARSEPDPFPDPSLVDPVHSQNSS